VDSVRDIAEERVSSVFLCWRGGCRKGYALGQADGRGAGGGGRDFRHLQGC